MIIIIKTLNGKNVKFLLCRKKLCDKILFWNKNQMFFEFLIHSFIYQEAKK